MAQILSVKLEIVDEGGFSWGTIEEQLVVTNIPHGWSLKRVNPSEDEKAGIGTARADAVVDWLHRNHYRENPLLILYHDE